MSITSRYNNFISRFSPIRNFVFYLMLTTELLMAIYERSDLPLSTPSYVFRATFLMTMVVILLTEYSAKEWIAICITAVFTFFCYRVCGNNDLLRVSMFVISCKGVNIKKALNYFFTVSFIGYAAIFVAALTGIYGNISITDYFGRSVGTETRYSFGFGHPNTVHSVLFALSMLVMYLLKDESRKKRKIAGSIILVLNILLFVFTDSKTGFFITIFMLIGLIPSLLSDDEKPGIYYAIGVAVSGLSVVLSVVAAAVSQYAFENPFSFSAAIDRMLTGRIIAFYGNTPEHKGTISSWTLFGDSNSGETYFDMGWVRLFYWYGIIPGIIVTVILFILLYRMYRQKDYDTFVMLVSMFLYTIVEATYVSSYIGRNFMLMIWGAYIFLACREEKDAGER
ncbi:hypothetical protein [Butyrivibrio sp. MB2005]|uniref:hypothetical protein n=1 Tax=Butyrivibrio sp. MB2005 TaxID=1280678 RepID=UPI00047D1FD2|nr:hypothetical protein [Butyrivibrio sp. MB2005]